MASSIDALSGGGTGSTRLDALFSLDRMLQTRQNPLIPPAPPRRPAGAAPGSKPEGARLKTSSGAFFSPQDIWRASQAVDVGRQSQGTINTMANADGRLSKSNVRPQPPTMGAVAPQQMPAPPSMQPGPSLGPNAMNAMATQYGGGAASPPAQPGAAAPTGGGATPPNLQPAFNQPKPGSQEYEDLVKAGWQQGPNGIQPPGTTPQVAPVMPAPTGGTPVTPGASDPKKETEGGQEVKPSEPSKPADWTAVRGAREYLPSGEVDNYYNRRYGKDAMKQLRADRGIPEWGTPEYDEAVWQANAGDEEDGDTGYFDGDPSAGQEGAPTTMAKAANPVSTKRKPGGKGQPGGKRKGKGKRGRA